ncbi:hypothetical protein U9M48_018791, partial [Paspalum notatum var. saurae]
KPNRARPKWAGHRSLVPESGLRWRSSDLFYSRVERATEKIQKYSASKKNPVSGVVAASVRLAISPFPPPSVPRLRRSAAPEPYFTLPRRLGRSRADLIRSGRRVPCAAAA